MMSKQIPLIILFFLLCQQCFCWGFYAHKKINYYAVFLLPPQMMTFYKPHIQFISEHAVDPDKKRYLLASEGAHHFIDIDHYGKFPFDSLPRPYNQAIARYTDDTLKKYGICPWWVQIMEKKLTTAFKEKDQTKILKLSAEIGHYIADAHVPLHTNSNHNGQLTDQEGIHAFWESRIPELLAEKEWSFFVQKAEYISDPGAFIWARILESARAADTVLRYEKELSLKTTRGREYAFEYKNGKLVKQFSTDYAVAYNKMLHGMIERRMKQSIFAVACFWYTAWVNAGQPDLTGLSQEEVSGKGRQEFDELEQAWRNNEIKGRKE